MSSKNKESKEKMKDISSTSKGRLGKFFTPRHMPGILIGGILLVLTIVLTGFLLWLNLIPIKYLIPLVIGLLIVSLALGVVTWNPKKRKRFSIGAIIALFVAAGLVYGIVAAARIGSTLDTMTGNNTEKAQIAVYVNKDDPAQTLEDAANYSFGILQTLDRDNTDEVLSMIEERLGAPVALNEYTGLNEIVDALFAQETGAMILNTAYLDVFEEMEGYSDVKDKIREIAMFELEQEIDNGEEYTGDGEIVTCYISGIDSRTGLVAKSRSDVNIIATINTKTRQISLVSTPRDYFVPLTISNGVPDKLTHAGIYGVDVSKGTLEMLYETKIDYYFRVNFSGFEQIVDSLGGVTVDSEKEFRSRDGYYYAQGENVLNGAQALSFVRERKAFVDGDFQRGRNQMALIKGVLKKVASPEILGNYSNLLAAMEGSFEMSIPDGLIKQIVRDELDGGKEEWNIVSYAVSGSGAMRKPYSMSVNASVIIPDETTVEKAKELMRQVRDGETAVDPNTIVEEEDSDSSAA